MNLEGIMLTKINKDKYLMISLCMKSEKAEFIEIEYISGCQDFERRNAE